MIFSLWKKRRGLLRAQSPTLPILLHNWQQTAKIREIGVLYEDINYFAQVARSPVNKLRREEDHCWKRSNLRQKGQGEDGNYFQGTEPGAPLKHSDKRILEGARGRTMD